MRHWCAKGRFMLQASILLLASAPFQAHKHKQVHHASLLAASNAAGGDIPLHLILEFMKLEDQFQNLSSVPKMKATECYDWSPSCVHHQPPTLGHCTMDEWNLKCPSKCGRCNEKSTCELQWPLTQWQCSNPETRAANCGAFRGRHRHGPQ